MGADGLTTPLNAIQSEPPLLPYNTHAKMPTLPLVFRCLILNLVPLTMELKSHKVLYTSCKPPTH